MVIEAGISFQPTELDDKEDMAVDKVYWPMASADSFVPVQPDLKNEELRQEKQYDTTT